MELSFESEEIRDICERRASATEALGAPATAALLRSLADIDAVGTVLELREMLGDAFKHASSEVCTISIGTDHLIVFQSGHATQPKTSAGATDWDRVTRLRIMAIGKNHD